MERARVPAAEGEEQPRAAAHRPRELEEAAQPLEDDKRAQAEAQHAHPPLAEPHGDAGGDLLRREVALAGEPLEEGELARAEEDARDAQLELVAAHLERGEDRLDERGVAEARHLGRHQRAVARGELLVRRPRGEARLRPREALGSA